jgi:hypothetical protein
MFVHEVELPCALQDEATPRHTYTAGEPKSGAPKSGAP